MNDVTDVTTTGRAEMNGQQGVYRLLCDLAVALRAESILSPLAAEVLMRVDGMIDQHDWAKRRLAKHDSVRKANLAEDDGTA